MKKYVFSYINFFDNELESKVIESDLDALTVAVEQLTGRGLDIEDESIQTIEDLKNFAFDCDSMLEIIEV